MPFAPHTQICARSSCMHNGTLPSLFQDSAGVDLAHQGPALDAPHKDGSCNELWPSIHTTILHKLALAEVLDSRRDIGAGGQSCRDHSNRVVVLEIHELAAACRAIPPLAPCLTGRPNLTDHAHLVRVWLRVPSAELRHLLEVAQHGWHPLSHQGIRWLLQLVSAIGHARLVWDLLEHGLHILHVAVLVATIDGRNLLHEIAHQLHATFGLPLLFLHVLHLVSIGDRLCFHDVNRGRLLRQVGVGLPRRFHLCIAARPSDLGLLHPVLSPLLGLLGGLHSLLRRRVGLSLHNIWGIDLHCCRVCYICTKVKLPLLLGACIHIGELGGSLFMCLRSSCVFQMLHGARFLRTGHLCLLRLLLWSWRGLHN
mmetsp:Transcript_32790/g.74651  ORF Transcript_32790/g.74651 Transcript_32790/m.74651 type:complete len:368 (-) Transcript_32790:10-1113(-)